MKDRIIFESADKNYRIIEYNDDTSLNDLKGDSFSAEANPGLSPVQLKKEELAFEKIVDREGVYGYVLEKWNPAPGCGYEHIDICFGFIGEYRDIKDSSSNHYIVDEMKGKIK